MDPVRAGLIFLSVTLLLWCVWRLIVASINRAAQLREHLRIREELERAHQEARARANEWRLMQLRAVVRDSIVFVNGGWNEGSQAVATRSRNLSEILEAMRHKKFVHPMPEYGYHLQHEDECGKLWVLDNWIWGNVRQYAPTHKDEGTVVSHRRVVEVVDPSTAQVYFLTLPPWDGHAEPGHPDAYIQTARAAVAWTFGLAGYQYRPQQET